MLNNKKGAALLQVLLVTVVLAGMATMLLRASLSRTTTARQTRRTVSAQLLVNACMAEVNTIWSSKKPAVFASDMNQCIMYCKTVPGATGCPENQKVKEYTCSTISLEGITYTVKATMDGTKNGDGQCKLDYIIDDNAGANNSSVTL